MKEYVIAMVKSGRSICFIEKNRPLWQKNRINLPGGHIEKDDETPENAIRRELQEETGLQNLGKIICTGKITDNINYVVYCFSFDLDKRQELIQMTDERVFFSRFCDVRDNPNLIPNLKVIIPLFMSRVGNWTIIDNTNSFDGNKKKLEIIL